MNTTRIWLSLDAWWDNRELFLVNLEKEVEINRKLGLKGLAQGISTHRLFVGGGLLPIAD